MQKGRYPRAAAPCTVPPTRAVRAAAPDCPRNAVWLGSYMFPLSLLPSRGILDPDCALVLRNSCIVSRETAGKTHGTFIFCTHKYRNSSAQALPYPCSRGCFLFLRQPPLQFIYPPQRFCSFSPGLFAKRPTSPRRSALYSTACARGTRHGALILRKTRKTRTGHAEKPAGAAVFTTAPCICLAQMPPAFPAAARARHLARGGGGRASAMASPTSYGVARLYCTPLYPHDYACVIALAPAQDTRARGNLATTASDPPSHNFFSFSPGLFAKRPTSPRRSALYSTAYARGARRSALILRKTRKTRTGRAEKPAGAAISIARPFFLQGAG